MAEQGIPGSTAISQRALLGFVWGGVALSFGFFLFRLYVRLTVLHHIFWDDAVVLMAWLMTLATAIIWQVLAKDLYYMVSAVSYTAPSSASGIHAASGEYISRIKSCLPAVLATYLLFYSTLWSIKLSFLIFFRRLGQSVKRLKIIWWSVFVFTVASYVYVDGPLVNHVCANLIDDCNDPSARRYRFFMVRLATALDIMTDAAIILVPTNILWAVRISIQQKLALAGIFSLTVFIMGFAITRIIILNSSKGQLNLVWVLFWGSIETTVAIIVACLASFRALFTRMDRSPRLQNPRNEHDNVPIYPERKRSRSLET